MTRLTRHQYMKIWELHDRVAASPKFIDIQGGIARLNASRTLKRFIEVTFGRRTEEADELTALMRDVESCRNEIDRAYARIRMDDFLRIRTFGRTGGGHGTCEWI